MLRIIPRKRVQFPEGSIRKLLKYALEKKLVEGTDIADFEKRFAAFIRVKHAIAVPKARIGLYLILKALKITKDDEVLLSSYNYLPISNIIREIGAKPIFADAEPETYNINPKLVEQKITDKTRAIVATHMEGLPCELNSILEITKKYKIYLIEDCAHSLAAEYMGRKVGSFGDASIFSFGLEKHLNTVQGGMIVTNSNELADIVRSEMRYFKPPTNFKVVREFISSDIASRIRNSAFFSFALGNLIWLASILNLNLMAKVSRIEETGISEFSRYSNFQASLGILQLESIESKIRRRIKNAEILGKYLNSQAKTQRSSGNVQHAYLNYSIQSPNRRAIREKLSLHGIGAEITLMKSCSPFSPVSRRLENEILYLPFYENLDEASIIFIANVLNRVLKQSSA